MNAACICITCGYYNVQCACTSRRILHTRTVGVARTTSYMYLWIYQNTTERAESREIYVHVQCRSSPSEPTGTIWVTLATVTPSPLSSQPATCGPSWRRPATLCTAAAGWCSRRRRSPAGGVSAWGWLARGGESAPLDSRCRVESTGCRPCLWAEISNALSVDSCASWRWQQSRRRPLEPPQRRGAPKELSHCRGKPAQRIGWVTRREDAHWRLQRCGHCRLRAARGK